MKVYQAINKVTAELAQVGIGKNRKNNSQGSGFNFRGIDDVLNALAPLLASSGLCVLPRVKSRVCVERQSSKGGALFFTTIECDFDFISAEDGSKHTVTTFGEAMDSGDKGTNKAMSAAYKYAALQAFCIPVEGTPDADYDTHEVVSKEGEWLITFRAAAMEGMDVLTGLFAEYTEQRGFKEFWAKNKDSLKKAASEADQQFLIATQP